jgi:Gas vesicle protein
MSTPAQSTGRFPQTTMGSRQPAQLADVLERVLDKGIVIAGDIQINLLDIELLTIRLRLLVASADKAREMGIDWWEGDPFLRGGTALESRLKRLEAAAGLESGNGNEPGEEEEKGG